MNPEDLIRQLLGQERTPNEYVDENFPRPSHDQFLPDAPEPSIPVIDRTHSTEDAPSPQEYIQRSFEDMQDPQVDEGYVLPNRNIRPMAYMQGLPQEPQPGNESDIMRYLGILTDRFSKNPEANPRTEDRIFGTYGYDPEEESRQGYTPELPPVGGGRHQIYPPTKEFGTDDMRRIMRDFNYDPSEEENA